MLTYVPCMHVALLLYLRGTSYYYTINDVTILSELHDSPPRSHTCLLPYYSSFPRSRILLDYSYYCCFFCYFFAPPITSPIWSYFWARLVSLGPYRDSSISLYFGFVRVSFANPSDFHGLLCLNFADYFLGPVVRSFSL